MEDRTIHSPEGLGAGAAQGLVQQGGRALSEIERSQILQARKAEERRGSYTEMANIGLRRAREEQDKSDEIYLNEVGAILRRETEAFWADGGLATRMEEDSLSVLGGYKEATGQALEKVAELQMDQTKRARREADVMADKWRSQWMIHGSKQQSQAKNAYLRKQRQDKEDWQVNQARFTPVDLATGKLMNPKDILEIQQGIAGNQVGILLDETGDPKVALSGKSMNLAADRINSRVSKGFVLKFRDMVNGVGGATVQDAIRFYEENPNLFTKPDYADLRVEVNDLRDIAMTEALVEEVEAFTDVDSKESVIMNDPDIPEHLKAPAVQMMETRHYQAKEMEERRILQERSDMVARFATGEAMISQEDPSWTPGDLAIVRLNMQLSPESFPEASNSQVIDDLKDMDQRELLRLGLQGLLGMRASLSLEDYRAWADKVQRISFLHYEASLPQEGPYREMDKFERRVRGPDVHSHERKMGRIRAVENPRLEDTLEFDRMMESGEMDRWSLERMLSVWNGRLDQARLEQAVAKATEEAVGDHMRFKEDPDPHLQEQLHDRIDTGELYRMPKRNLIDEFFYSGRYTEEQALDAWQEIYPKEPIPYSSRTPEESRRAMYELIASGRLGSWSSDQMKSWAIRNRLDEGDYGILSSNWTGEKDQDKSGKVSSLAGKGLTFQQVQTEADRLANLRVFGQEHVTNEEKFKNEDRADRWRRSFNNILDEWLMMSEANKGIFAPEDLQRYKKNALRGLSNERSTWFGLGGGARLGVVQSVNPEEWSQVRAPDDLNVRQLSLVNHLAAETGQDLYRDQASHLWVFVDSMFIDTDYKSQAEVDTLNRAASYGAVSVLGGWGPDLALLMARLRPQGFRETILQLYGNPGQVPMFVRNAALDGEVTNDAEGYLEGIFGNPEVPPVDPVIPMSNDEIVEEFLQ